MAITFATRFAVFFTLQCACAGSTSGVIKVDRFVLFGKALQRQIFNLRHPKGVFLIKLEGAAIDDQAIESALDSNCLQAVHHLFRGRPSNGLLGCCGFDGQYGGQD